MKGNTLTEFMDDLIYMGGIEFHILFPNKKSPDTYFFD